MRLLVLTVCMGLILVACEQEQLLDPLPSSDHLLKVAAVEEGLLLASTNQGELYAIDLDMGLATRIGDAGIYAGKDIRWSDIAFDREGNLFAVTNRIAEAPSGTCSPAGFYNHPLDACAHLYRVDPATGQVIAEVGNTGLLFLSDIDFGPDGALFASFYNNEQERGDGALGILDPTTGVGTLVGEFGSIAGEFLENGGLTMDWSTGELWAAENRYPLLISDLFKADRLTGGAYSPFSTTPPSPGFDALQSLPDGRLIGFQGGQSSKLLEIVADESGGMAVITEIPLIFDVPPTGSLNGLAVVRTLGPANLTDEVERLVEGGMLGASKSSALLAKVRLIEEHLEDGRTNQALRILDAFIMQVEAYVSAGILSQDDGQGLIDLANIIRKSFDS